MHPYDFVYVCVFSMLMLYIVLAIDTGVRCTKFAARLASDFSLDNIIYVIEKSIMLIMKYWVKVGGVPAGRRLMRAHYYL